ncbi:MAG TPA: anthranilate phosphoribosyltransferase [Candidatus Dormibacteraeota bacterium]|nr:anthranilate phosphoribosyltransferase [Candidatus Dormibacteraeota bacterium]
MNVETYLKQIKSGKSLDRIEAKAFLGLIIDDENLPDSSIAEVLTVLTKKGVNAEEICGFIDAMRAHMVHVPYTGPAIDTCGTGGDKSGTFNISTATAILLAAGGVTVAKHGNRAATSKCGSADVLEALGVPIDQAPEAAAHALTTQKFAFLFAPMYHPALKRLSIVRKQLGFPTVFNLLGPLLNPADVKRQVIGTFSLANAKLLADVASKMGYEHAMVITSDDGLDEASLSAPVRVFEIKREQISESVLQAANYVLKPASVSALKGGDAAQNAILITAALKPSKILTAHQEIIMFNAGLGFYVAGSSPSIEDGIKKAAEVLANGQAEAKLQELSEHP